MIKYSEIIKKIENIKYDTINEFNKKVSIPMFLSMGDSKIITDNQNIIIVNNSFQSIITLDDRIAFFEILFVLKNIEKDLYNKIPFMYVDYFEKFKLNDNKKVCEVIEDFDDFTLSKLAVSILSIINIKFWCVTDVEKKEALEVLFQHDNKKIEKKSNNVVEKVVQPENLIQKNNGYLIKNTIWIKILNKFRKIIENFRDK